MHCCVLLIHSVIFTLVKILLPMMVHILENSNDASLPGECIMQHLIVTLPPVIKFKVLFSFTFNYSIIELLICALVSFLKCTFLNYCLSWANVHEFWI